MQRCSPLLLIIITGHERRSSEISHLLDTLACQKYLEFSQSLLVTIFTNTFVNYCSDVMSGFVTIECPKPWILNLSLNYRVETSFFGSENYYLS